MNPAIASSKRFLIHEQDYTVMRGMIAETEYLVEFLLVDSSHISTFASAYQTSSLPQTGPAIDQGLFRIMNSLSDGLVAGVVILMSLLLIVIAILSLRFTLMATIEEDTKEIGVMKAIGIALAGTAVGLMNMGSNITGILFPLAGMSMLNLEPIWSGLVFGGIGFVLAGLLALLLTETGTKARRQS